jgi:hypothetical protein
MRFDELTKALGAQRSRRVVLGALAGAALASIGLRGEAAAALRPARRALPPRRQLPRPHV